MPPEPEHGSSRLSQSLIALSISRDVLPQLPRPIVSVRRRLSAVLRAGVPKAPVHLHRDALSRERRADSYAPARQRGIVLPEAQADLVQRRAHPNLWSSVLGAIFLHSPPHPLRRCPGIEVRRRSCTRPWDAISTRLSPAHTPPIPVSVWDSGLEIGRPCTEHLPGEHGAFPLDGMHESGEPRRGARSKADNVARDALKGLDCGLEGPLRVLESDDHDCLP